MNKIRHTSETWLALKALLESDREHFVMDIVTDLDEIATAKLRGRIQQIDEILELPSRPK